MIYTGMKILLNRFINDYQIMKSPEKYLRLVLIMLAITIQLQSFTLLNHGVGGLFHVTYICHDINLIVQSAFDYIKDTIPKLNMFGFLLKPRKVDLSVINKLAKDSM